MRSSVKKIAIFTISSLFCAQSFAAPFTQIRIGDIDGFGFDALGFAGVSALTGDGGAADRNGNGRLNAGDVLPSLNGGGIVATNNGDDFDNRSSESISISAGGIINSGSTGSAFTDISLSTSYDASSAAGNVYDANTNTTGAGGAFPAGSSATVPNQPGFIFDFSVAVGDIAVGTGIFFNMLFGDYDVTPAQIDFTFAGGADTASVSAQNNGPDDGLIQAAFSTLAFADVFTLNGAGTHYNGYVGVNFDAPFEPYTAFDFVELSVTPISAVPEPGTIGLLLLSLLGLRARSRKLQSI